MCLALSKPAGIALAKAAMQHAYTANPDGCGFAVRIGNHVLIEKGLWSFQGFWKRFEPYQCHAAIVHFRWASMGDVTRDNCHPFTLVGGGALIHNGHMSGYGSKTQSDTAHWVETVLNPLLSAYPDALSQPSMRRVLEDSIHGSKMVLLTPQGTVILGEAHGHVQGGIWYSNASYLPPKLDMQSRLETFMQTQSTEDEKYRGAGIDWDEDAQEMDGMDSEEEDIFCEGCYTGAARHGVCRRCLDTIGDTVWHR